MERRVTRRIVERLRKLISGRYIVRAYRDFLNANRRARNMVAFILNPYNAGLDLVDRDDYKLSAEVSKGLKEEDILSGNKIIYNNFVNLTKKGCKDVRLISTLNIPTVWDTGNANTILQGLPTEAGIVDML